MFKGVWSGQIDRRFRDCFPPGAEATIRLDEIDWGWVVVNGIPPLEHPRHLAAAEVTYLDDDHIVFGMTVNGESRAYLKRILAWHEMVLDTLGGVELTVVYWVNSTGRRNTSMMRCCNAETETETVRPGGSACDAFAWSAAGNGACGAATVLEGDRAGAVE